MTPFDFAVWAQDNGGVRVEMVGRIPVWEPFPGAGHQGHVFRIERSIGGNQAFYHASSVYIRFSDGSLKRPDIAIFCNQPTEQTNTITMLPEAVVEVISPDYEGKDLQIGVPFYLHMGIKDILVLDPDTDKVSHFRPGKSVVEHQSPVALTLECGCQITV